MAEGTSRSQGRAIELLQEAKQLLESTFSTQPNTTGNEPSVAPSVVPSSSRGTPLTSVAFQEHRRLFGFNPSSATYTSRKRSKDSAKSQNKKSKRPTWTRTFVCLADKSTEKSPTPTEYRALKAANLGEKRLTFFSDCTSLEFDQKMKIEFPKLESVGGYALLSGGHRRELTMAIEPPYTGPRLKENLVGHGKIFVRPLQRDLDVTPIHNCGDTDERGQDNGGPRKEFFVLALRAIKEKYFDDGLNHSCANDYQMVGIIMSLSMLQNGPLPQFMRESTLEASFFDEESTISPCLKQLRNGLSELGIFQMARKFPTFLHLLRKNPASELSLKRLVKLFEPHFSELGTNKRKHEEDAYGSLVKYFREVARGKRNSGMISLGDILQFVTGTNVEPVLGFAMEPSLLFVDVDTKLGFYQTANTCINCMHLPIPTSTTPLPSEEILFNVYDYSFSNFCFSNV